MSYNNPTGSEKVKFSDKENQFLLNNEMCRVATLKNSIPHVVPVAYAFADDLFFFVTGYNTIKYRNLKENKNVSLVVDIYDL